MDSNLGDSELEWFSNLSTFSSEFEIVVEHETTIGDTNAVDDIVTGSSRLDVRVGLLIVDRKISLHHVKVICDNTGLILMLS